MSTGSHTTLLRISYSSLAISCTWSSTACAQLQHCRGRDMPACTSSVLSPARICLPAAQYNTSKRDWKVGRQKGCAGTGRYPCKALPCNPHPSNPAFSDTGENNNRARPKAHQSFSDLLLSNFLDKRTSFDIEIVYSLPFVAFWFPI